MIQSKELMIRSTFGQKQVMVLHMQRKDECKSDVGTTCFSNSKYL